MGLQADRLERGRLIRPFAVCATAFVLSTAMLGCEIVAFPFFAYHEFQKTQSHIEPAAYTGLDGQSFAVLVSGDRGLHADFPGMVPQITNQVAERLKAETKATGYVPAAAMLRYQYENPGWSARAFSEVADDLGVDRLVVVDIQEFRLNDPGNRFLYDGVAAATVAVVEADGLTPDDIAFEFFVNVTFPDAGGFGPEDFSSQEVASVLMTRFVNRATWPFYDAEIPNELSY
ncbi:MAG: hypothetical protein AAFN41_00295 [Planctomycetota bacterium]